MPTSLRANNRTPGVGLSGLVAGLVLLFVPLPAGAQQPPPDGEWWSLRTEHFTVTFPPALEGIAREAAEVAERVHAVLRDDLVPAPRGMIDLVVTDHVDFTNGYATPFPSNRIVVFARPPLDMIALANTRDWIELVVAHELVHIFHLDVTGRVGGAVRGIFGRVPMFWPLFPAVATPGWSVEGLATHYESRLTGAGRVHGSFHDMVVRTAALEGRIPDLDEVSTPNPVWPAGQRSYIYGATFMRWLAERYGPDVHGRLVEATAGAQLPPFLFFGPVAEDVLDRDFGSLYDEWREHARARAAATAEAMRAAGLTTTEPVPGLAPSEPTPSERAPSERAPGTPFVVWPRVSPDGRLLAYSADDLRSAPATRLLDLATGRATILARRNQSSMLLGPASWLPDGSGLVTAQLEFRGPWRLHSDLWSVDLDGTETRLTTGARLERPDVAPDGRRVVAVQNRDGAMPLVVHDLATGLTSALADAPPGEGFTTPRWSPDGRTVAAARFRDGRTDLVLLDAASGTVTPLTRDDAIDLSPAWTPDGRHVLFWSDRSGIPNLYAADGAGTIFRVTNVLGGAFDPDVSPDGRWIYFAAYHHDGWRLERIPFDPAAWRTAAPAVAVGEDPVLPPPPAPAAAMPDVPLARYSPRATLRPTYWLPTYLTASAGPDRLRMISAFTTGQDVLARHTWEATAAVDVGTGRIYADAGWRWRGLGVPEITLRGGRDWNGAGTVRFPDNSTEGLWLREDRLALDALFLRRRWRATGWLQAGAEVRSRAYDLHRGGDEGDAIIGTLDLPDLPNLLGARIGAGWGNARSFPYSISLQDGVSVSGSARRWWEADGLERSHDELQGRVAAYRGIPWWGFADHVLAGRLSALTRLGDRAVPTSIGGAAGSPESVLVGLATLGGSNLFLPVRGYDHGDRIGTRAWTASAEYRLPLHLVGRHGDLLGFSITALSGALFADAGDAWCDSPFTGCAPEPGDPLLSAGAEISLDFGILHGLGLRLRGGLAVPFTDVNPADGRSASHPRNWQGYLVFGPSF